MSENLPAFGLIGLNGAGKTTCVKALLGVITPTAGELRVLGGSPEDVTVHARNGCVPERLAIPRSGGVQVEMARPLASIAAHFGDVRAGSASAPWRRGRATEPLCEALTARRAPARIPDISQISKQGAPHGR